MWLSVRFWFLLNLLALFLFLLAHFGLSTQLKAWAWWPDAFGVLTNLLTGGLISFLFYFLVVLVPETRKKSIIKGNLKKVYRSIKRDLLWQVIFASIKGGRHDLTTEVSTVEKLMNVEAFRAAFAHGREADEGFYAFENQMSSETIEFREIILCLQALSKQIDFVLHNYTIEDERIFEFFKRLEIFLLRLQSTKPGYDESKALCGFIWEIFSGFNFVDGYRGFDPVEKMIDDI